MLGIARDYDRLAVRAEAGLIPAAPINKQPAGRDGS
jgi:hypothetical protein